jgi:HlyD family secretion protein|nr:efflux RND transporter periplasmic adaptor subunit [Candidatus Acidoferrales bacterium]
MKVWKKVCIGVVVVAAAGGIVAYSVNQANKDVVTVQTAKVGQEHLTTVVTASGQVMPKTYSNILAQGFGQVTEILVKEGDQVKRGDILLRTDDIQPAANAQAGKSGIDSASAALQAAEASCVAAQADVKTQEANLDNNRISWERGQTLYQQGLIPKQDYDTRKTLYDGSVAAVASAQAKVPQCRANVEQARHFMEQNKAQLVATADILNKTTYRAPIDGIVTYIAVRKGENMVPGIENSTGSYMMTISDMSIVTSEVMVDETDIINIRAGQPATITVDALPGQTFTGKVTEVGNQAVLRSSGLASTQSTTGSQEAKDFKVVVTVDHPPAGLRNGLSSTAKIVTAEKDNVLAIPIQALAVRSRKQLEDAAKIAAAKQGGGSSVTLAAAKPTDTNSTDAKKDDIQGVFVIRNGKALFVQVTTGISGITDIEITNGLQKGDEIVTGSYKALRTLRPDTPVKIDNTTPAQTSETT